MRAFAFVQLCRCVLKTAKNQVGAPTMRSDFSLSVTNPSKIV
jgi:hypothetical protein